GEEPSAGEEAEEWLHGALGDGPRPAADTTRAARAAGISDRTLRRARRRVGVISAKQKGTLDGTWNWSLPGSVSGHEAPKGANHDEGGQDSKPEIAGQIGR